MDRKGQSGILCKKKKTKSNLYLSNMVVGALDSHTKSNGHKKAESISNILPEH